MIVVIVVVVVPGAIVVAVVAIDGRARGNSQDGGENGGAHVDDGKGLLLRVTNGNVQERRILLYINERKQ